MNAVIPTSALVPDSMDSAIRLAEMMARGKLVPTHLQSSPGDCLMVIEAATRWGMSPFAVAQCTSVIQGKLMFEGKLVAAALNASGIMQSRLDYQHSGEGAGRAVMVSGVLKGETKPRTVTVTLQEARTNNGMWTKQPDQQLVYAGTRVWARRHAPEVMLGVYTPEEFDQQDAKAEPHNGQTIDAEPASVSDRDRINRDVPLNPTPQPQRMKIGDWLTSIEIALRDATDAEAINRILDRQELLEAPNVLKGAALDRFLAIREAARSRAAPFPPLEDEDAWPGDETSRERETAGV